jgi:FkbH-like protein
VSKNAPEDIWALLEQHPDCLLRESDFAAHRINWNRKSDNLRELAAELNLGLDAFVFLDDNPAERADIEANCPAVTVVPLPTDAAGYAGIIDRLWCFDGLGVSPEDRQRTLMLQQEQQRRGMLSENQDLQGYLHALELHVTFARAEPAILPRLAQLIQKTNQFNLSLRRRNLQEITRLADSGAGLWTVAARDRFGDYGLVGVGILLPGTDPAYHELDTFLLSCRALGRGVEEAFLHGICSAARANGAEYLLAPYAEGPRNQPVLEFFRNLGCKELPEQRFVLDLKDLPPIPSHLNFHGPHPG